MWFNPSELLTVTSCPPANLANLANFERSNQQDRPEISRISKISNPVEVSTEIGTAEISKISKISSGLTEAQKSKLLDYMAAIDERDPEMINELLTECGKDVDKLAWALNWADKVLAAQAQPEQGLITCRNCQHFQCYNAHGGGAGSCGAGVLPFGACHWSETQHDCGKYLITDKSRG